MPRFDYHAPVAAPVSSRSVDEVLLRVLWAEINTLRQEMQLPPRTVAQLMQTLTTVQQAMSPPAPAGGA
jgi:hypothetical protein